MDDVNEIKVNSVIEAVETVITTEIEGYYNTEDEAVAKDKINNICRLMSAVTEAKKVEYDKFKTEAEIELKNEMNNRDNLVKQQVTAQELEFRKKQLLADKITDGAVLTANVAKNIATAAWIGGVTEGEFNGYTERSTAVKALTDFGKQSIRTRF